MAKVIVERPRSGWIRASRRKGYRKYVQKSGPDNLPRRECMLGKWRGQSKWFNEHLGPLRRYLRSQVGRPWDKVHSEIRKHICYDTVVQAHVLTHVFQYVTTNVEIRNGVAYSREGLGYWMMRPIPEGNFYVCPKTGILRVVKSRSRLFQRTRICVDDSLQYHSVNGVWHELRLRKLPLDFQECWDAFLNERLGKLPSRKLIQTYGTPIYAISAKPLKRTEAKKMLRKLESQFAGKC